MDIIDRYIDEIGSNPPRIVFPEGNLPVIIQSAGVIMDKRIARPVLLGDVAMIRKTAALNCYHIDDLELIDITDNEYTQRLAKVYADTRKVDIAIGRRAMRKPLYLGGMLVNAGIADGMIAGKTYLTASVIRAAALTVGTKSYITKPSSFMIIIQPDFNGEQNKMFLFADTAVNVWPSDRELAEITVETAAHAKRLLGIEPVAALLSFSSKGSSGDRSLNKIRRAVDIVHELAPDLEVDGELQFDTAIHKGIAGIKAKGSKVAGRANVLIFPDLNAGNIGYKIAEYLGGATAIGPILQGFKRPVNDLSRGSSLDDIIGTAVITALQTLGKEEE